MEMLSAPKLLTRKHTKRSLVVDRLSGRSATQNCTRDTHISDLVLLADAVRA